MLGPLGASGGVGVSECTGGLARSVGTQGQKGIGGIRDIGAPRGVGGCQGCGSVRGVLGAGSKCRYSGARRSRGGIWVHLGFLGGVGFWEPLGGVRGYQGCIGGLARSVGTQGPEGA